MRPYRAHRSSTGSGSPRRARPADRAPDATPGTVRGCAVRGGSWAKWFAAVQKFPQLLGESFPAERLGQKVCARLDLVIDHGVFGVTGKIEHLDIRPHALERFRYLLAVHFRHYHVRQKYGNVTGEGSADRNGLLAGGCGKDAVAQVLQQAYREIADRLLIFHHEDRIQVFRCDPLGRFAPGFRGQLVDPRKIQLKRGALAHFTIDPDVSAALLHHTVHGGEAESGSLPSLFGGEERFKGALAHLRVHAVTGIGDRDHHVLTRFDTQMRLDISVIQTNVRGL